MFSKRFVLEIKNTSIGRAYARPGKPEITWVTPIDVERGSHMATARCLDAMSALASLNRYATAYAVAAQCALESDLEVEDGLGQQGAANADAERLAEAKQGFDFAAERFRSAVARLAVCDPS